MSLNFEGKHIKNQSDTLIIVFQGVFSKTNKDYSDGIIKGNITAESVSKLHGYYHFMKLSKKNEHRDYLYLKDYYSGLYGWYIFDNGKFIYKELSKKIDEFILANKYKKVYLVGSSKGGAGAIMLALNSGSIDKIFTMVPDLRISTEGFGKSGEKLFFNDDENFKKEVKQIFKNEQIFKNIQNRKEIKPTFFFFTGTRDYGFKGTVNLHRKFIEELGIESHLLIMPTPELHNPLIKNHSNLIDYLINNINKNKLWTEEEFISVSENVHIASYKSIGMK